MLYPLYVFTRIRARNGVVGEVHRTWHEISSSTSMLFLAVLLLEHLCFRRSYVYYYLHGRSIHGLFALGLCWRPCVCYRSGRQTDKVCFTLPTPWRHHRHLSSPDKPRAYMVECREPHTSYRSMLDAASQTVPRPEQANIQAIDLVTPQPTNSPTLHRRV